MHSEQSGIMDYLEDNQKLIKSIADSKYWYEMRFFLCDMYEEYIAELMRGMINRVQREDSVPTSLSDEDFELNVSFYGLLFYSLGERWFFGGMKEPKREYINKCVKVFEKNLARFNTALQTARKEIDGSLFLFFWFT